MSDAITATSSSPSPPAIFFLQNLTKLGLGYSIAVALAVLVLLSSLLLAFYPCFRRQNPNPRNPHPNPNGVVLSQFIFVSEDDSDADHGGGASGLDPATVNSYPKFPYSASKGGDNVCSICLCEYKEGETMRMMPDCKHCFHSVCIDAWLKLSGSCPVCRTSPMLTPLSTPLSEVVPLSQYLMDRRRR